MSWVALWQEGSSWTRNWTCIPCISRQILNHWTPREVLGNNSWLLKNYYHLRCGCNSTHSSAKRSYPTSEVKGRSREDPRPEGQRPRRVAPRPRSGQQLRVPGWDGAGTAERSYPRSEVRGGGQEELPHARGQGLQLGGATPRPRSGGCAGTGGPRGAIPRSRSGGVVVKRYLSSKVRSSGCALLEHPWRDTQHPR